MVQMALNFLILVNLRTTNDEIILHIHSMWRCWRKIFTDDAHNIYWLNMLLMCIAFLQRPPPRMLLNSETANIISNLFRLYARACVDLSPSSMPKSDSESECDKWCDAIGSLETFHFLKKSVRCRMCDFDGVHMTYQSSFWESVYTK